MQNSSTSDLKLGRYARHQKALKEILLKVQTKFPNARIFERHVGLFYTHSGNPVKIGTKGEPDLVMYYPTQHGMVYIGIEVKTGVAKQSAHQKKYQKFVESLNGLYIVGRSGEQVISEILIYLSKLKS